MIIPPLPDAATNALLNRVAGKANLIKVWETVMLDQYCKGMTHATVLILYTFAVAYLIGRKRDR